MFHKVLRSWFAAALLSLMQPAGAVELGEIISVSRVDGALRVEIELRPTTDAFPQRSSCFTLAHDPPNPGGLPVVANGRATLRTLDGRHSVIVNSNQRVGEAALLSLRLSCGVDARRDYVLHLPPPEAVPVEVPLAAAPVFEPPQPQAETRLPPRKPRRVLPRPRPTGDRVAVSLTPADEALSRSLAAPADGPANYAAAGAEAVRLDADLRQLEATVARLRAEIESQIRARDLALAAAAAEPAARESPVRAAATAEAAPAVLPRSLKPDARDEAAFSANWLIAIGAAGALLVLAAYVLGRGWSRRRGGEPEAEQPVVALPRATPRVAAGADEDDPHGAPNAHKIEVVEPKSPLELAEFMLSFGRVDDAVMALEEHIASNPKSAIEPWRKLLEIYRKAGRRHAFDALARRMQTTFNVTAPTWERRSNGPRAR